MVSHCSCCISTRLLTPACKALGSGPAELSRCSQLFSPLSPPGFSQTGLWRVHEMLHEPSGAQTLTYGYIHIWKTPSPLLWQERFLLTLFMVVSESPPLRSLPRISGPGSFNRDSYRPLGFLVLFCFVFSRSSDLSLSYTWITVILFFTSFFPAPL